MEMEVYYGKTKQYRLTVMKVEMNHNQRMIIMYNDDFHSSLELEEKSYY